MPSCHRSHASDSFIICVTVSLISNVTQEKSATQMYVWGAAVVHRLERAIYLGPCTCNHCAQPVDGAACILQVVDVCRWRIYVDSVPVSHKNSLGACIIDRWEFIPTVN